MLSFGVGSVRRAFSGAVVVTAIGLSMACSVVLPMFGYPPHATRSTPPRNIENTVKSVSSPLQSLDLSTTAGDLQINGESPPTALFFFRGHWCPYCNTQLEDLNTKQAELKKMGVTLIGISADDVEDTMELKEDLKLDFHLASDPDLRAIKALGTLDSENEISWPAIVLIERGEVTYRWIAESTSERIGASEVVHQIKQAM